MLLSKSYQPSNLVNLLPASKGDSGLLPPILPRDPWRGTPIRKATCANVWPAEQSYARNQAYFAPALPDSSPPLSHLLYLFARQMEWERSAEPAAAWDVIAASRSPEADTRAHASALLERVLQHGPQTANEVQPTHSTRRYSTTEAAMRTPYGLEIIESCVGCKASREGFFCRLSQPVLRSVDLASRHSVMPPGALLFVEGQTPRGVFILCSGKVKLSTTSKEGKVLILKQVEAGDVMGLSAAISGTNYEMSAETATPCQINFIGRRDFMSLMQNESEIGMRASLWLSRDFQGAYRDLHDLVLARSSSGKLARLLLSHVPSAPMNPAAEMRLPSMMTHEEMAQRIGSSRETVTRLLSELKKKRLIRLEGARLVIRDRSGLEALAV